MYRDSVGVSPVISVTLALVIAIQNWRHFCRISETAIYGLMAVQLLKCAEYWFRYWWVCFERTSCHGNQCYADAWIREEACNCMPQSNQNTKLSMFNVPHSTWLYCTYEKSCSSNAHSDNCSGTEFVFSGSEDQRISSDEWVKIMVMVLYYPLHHQL